MKNLLKYFILGLVIMFLITYIFSLSDDANRSNGILGSIKYYFTWVLPYWWLIILIGSTIIAIVFFLIRKIFK
ncbi:MAG: hypothetical protein EAS48_09890 [Chryseobacterium sp.]|nr:MAG: hypothetical protein EAS48_09890 [Chryseobacterium sp.]